ncbi:hypothetical protein [Winogradskyella wandonensis]|uniref:hypothetical protein n=1 Tax=Winogradskyella wandonensis TaxID=1442586 RepID=UPI0010537F4D|nr:hypothetical protein [Winogradskyella wandonensis]
MAQYERGTINYLDGTKAKGFIKHKNFGGVKFKVSENSKPVSLDYSDISGYDITDAFYRYKKLKNKSPILLELIAIGRINLYQLNGYNPGLVDGNGNFNGFGAGSYSLFYIEKDNELIKLGTKFKKSHLKYLSSCVDLIDKIETKELKRKEVYKIVEYYNRNCF